MYFGNHAHLQKLRSLPLRSMLIQEQNYDNRTPSIKRRMIMKRHKMRTKINNTSCYHPLQLTGHKYKFPCHGTSLPLL